MYVCRCIHSSLSSVYLLLIHNFIYRRVLVKSMYDFIAFSCGTGEFGLSCFAGIAQRRRGLAGLMLMSNQGFEM